MPPAPVSRAAAENQSDLVGARRSARSRALAGYGAAPTAMVTCLPHLRKLSWSTSYLAKGRRDGLSPSNENVRPGEGVAWQGPRTLVLRKNAQGFGFTLRHFIVYPPESTMRTGPKDEENGNEKAYQCSNLEPMDTIFVKNVRENGPADQAGLCTGDRLVKVNGESVLGKTYSQVIALIQNCESVLELSIMPRDEDVLQLAYSQDAYLSGNEPYTGEAQDLPEPPPICYPRGRAQSHMGHNQTDKRGCRLAPARVSSPPDNRSGRASPAGWLDDTALELRGPNQGSPVHHTEEVQYGVSSQQAVGQPRGHMSPPSSSGPAHASPLHGYYGNHNIGATAQARVGAQPWPSPQKAALSRSEVRQQALTDWYYSQVPERRGPSMPPRYRSISQDRLGEVGVGVPPGRQRMGWPHSTSQDTLLLQPDSGQYGDSSWAEDWGCTSKHRSGRARSENLLASKYHRHGRSMEMLDRAAIMVSPRPDRPAWPPQQAPTPAPRTEVYQQQGPHYGAVPAPPASGRGQSHQQEQPPASQPRRLPLQSADDQPVGYRSYSPSFYRKAGRLMQAHSFRDPSYSGPHFNWNPTPKTSPQETVAAPPAAPEPRDGTHRPTNHERPWEEEQPHSQVQEVVLRQKPPTGRRGPPGQRQPHYGLPAEAAEALGFQGEGPNTATPRSVDAPRRTNGGLAPLTLQDDSLASIPFIDEPTSPSADLRARHVPASSVVSSVMSSAPAVTTSPTSPTFAFPLTRLFSHDCSNVKSNRRTSYLQAITTERSKSCEGLNTFGNEGHMFSILPKRVKSFFTDGSLDSLAPTEIRSKRHSTSELGSITFSDVRKEGWLHYKQILTEKGKKVGGGIRPWKRVFCVLRSHSLFLYKDKREAVLHGAALGGATGSGHGDEEQPISIRGCLADIAYSETKRKHVLRLGTQDFCEYLLQAEDRDDMLSWIKVIREGSKTDSEELGSCRQALINKKLNEYRKHSPTGNKPDSSPRVPRIIPPFLMAKMDNVTGAPRSPKPDSKEESSPPKSPWGINIMKKSKKSGPKAFGVRLEDCQPAINHKFVPLVVEICCGLVEQMGLEYTGVYRVPGNNAMVSTLQEQLNKGMDINPTEERWQDLNVISSLLKSFFRNLPEPVFTNDKYNDFIDANRMENASERLKTMRKLIHDLPDYYFHTLKFLMGHLKTVADHSEKNKMEPRNLALVFGPTLVRTSEDNMTDMVTHMPDRYKIVETLIQHFEWFFSEDLDKDEKTPVDKEDQQPVPNIDHLLSNIGRTAALPEASDSTNSESAKSKGSWGSKLDLNAKDLLSIVSAVTRARKRKKPLSSWPISNSTDEDSEQEPGKVSHCGGAEGDTAPRAEGEEDEEDEEEEEEGREATEEEEEPSCQLVEEAGHEGRALEQEEEGEACKAPTWHSPEDARSIVSGYSTLSTLGRGPASEGRGEEADDERSELVSETDNESGFASRSLTQERPEKPPLPPRSFLYTQYKSSTVPSPAPTPDPTPAEAPSNPVERSDSRARSTTPSSSSSSSATHKLNLRPSFNSHKLIQCDTLARKKTRAERAKGRSLSSELVQEPANEEDRTDNGEASMAPVSQAAALAAGSRPEGAGQSRTPPPAHSANLTSSSPAATGWGSLAAQVRTRILGSADDLRGVGLRKPVSPETRRRRRAWRRHTVVVGPGAHSTDPIPVQDPPTADVPKPASEPPGHAAPPPASEPARQSEHTAAVTRQTSRFHQCL
ncbi:rho GTPase-activating protein 23 isoform X2 [Paramormyrops kingsleyae]|uniref:Rho GTPase activating protein 23 n=1 Tax=Paramormyrops kingsleyae TaxID=1676925 RepID=A0A3B3QHH7_9TELE|nr:rho GTPase-activating protein 23 isoform X2 [Paramormyrops kingsleyae]